MITINQVVLNKKGQKGVISRIITKSTGYVEVVYENGTTKKEMAFNLTDEMGSSLKNAPKKQEPKTKTALEAAIEKMRWLNSCTYGDRFSPNYEVAAEPVIAVEMAARTVGNEFIQSVCQPGKENYTTYNTMLRSKRVRMYQYDYRAESGELFSCCAPTLEACREKRDKWLCKK